MLESVRAIFVGICLPLLGFGVIKLMKMGIVHLSQRKDLGGTFQI